MCGVEIILSSLNNLFCLPSFKNTSDAAAKIFLFFNKEYNVFSFITPPRERFTITAFGLKNLLFFSKLAVPLFKGTLNIIKSNF